MTLWQSLIVRMVCFCIVVVGILGFLYSPLLLRSLFYQKTINVLTWPTELDPEFISKFEEDTGIKVNFNYVESNEELLAKLQFGGIDAYDLVTASDYMIELMVRKDLLQRLEKSKFVHWGSLYPQLLKQYFDENNEYSIPFFWDVYGIGIDTDIINYDYAQQAGWALLFDPDKVVGYVGMSEDHREVVILAATYLKIGLNPQDFILYERVIADLLRMQKQWVARYTDARAGALIAAGTCSCAVTLSTDVMRLQKQHAHISFVVPRNGKFMVLDSFAIPKSSSRQEYVYQLLNYLYTPEILQRYVNKHTLRSARQDVQAEFVDDTYVPNINVLSQFDFFRTAIAEEKLSQLWISILS